MSEAIKFPQVSVIDALARHGINARSDASEITGTHAEKVKSFIEVGGGDRTGLALYKKLMATFDKNELKAKDQFHQLTFYLEKWAAHTHARRTPASLVMFGARA